MVKVIIKEIDIVVEEADPCWVNVKTTRGIEIGINKMRIKWGHHAKCKELEMKMERDVKDQVHFQIWDQDN